MVSSRGWICDACIQEKYCDNMCESCFWILGFAEMGKKGRFLLPIYRILHKYALMTDD
jgi:hypothetical protein